MNCPQCGTWNPDDKVTCWRCGTELPKPKPAPEKRRRPASMTWLWILIGVMAILMIVQTCVALRQLP